MWYLMFELAKLIHQMVLAFLNLLTKPSLHQVVLDFVDVCNQACLSFPDLFLWFDMREFMLELMDLSRQVMLASLYLQAQPSTRK